MNNFEKIKAMDVEEMAEFLIKECQLCPRITWNDCVKDCLENKKQWLQQESEE